MPTIKIAKLTTSELIRLRHQIDARLREAVSDLESELQEMRTTIGTALNGTASPGRFRRSRRGRGGGRKGTRPDSLPGRILAIVSRASGPVAVADIKVRLKLPKSKMNQVGVAFSALKKRGEIKSAGRGMYRAA
jgi:hypothetical protein